jgi:hypothetical protein
LRCPHALVPRRKKRMHELFGFPDSEGHQAGHKDRILDGGCIQNLLSTGLNYFYSVLSYYRSCSVLAYF